MKEISIGIVTYHEPISYGATMQCLGLQMYLISQGYRAEIIDYSSQGYIELRRTDKFNAYKIRLNRFMAHPIRFLSGMIKARQIATKQTKVQKELEIRNRKFDSFRKQHYVLSEKRYSNYSDLRNSPPEYNVYICGSDQIWNPSFCDMDDSYFLMFADNNRKMSYAPSFGVKVLPNYAKKEYAKRLNSFRYLSVRESTGATIIKDLTGKDVPVVIDPTFLIESNKWSSIADESSLILKDNYILTYFIGIDSYIEKYLQMVKKAFPNYSIKNLVFDKSDYGPADFLKAIRDARFVLTNSFHGLAFCINFNVPFAVGMTSKDYGGGAGFSRIENLLNLLNLNDRILEIDKQLDDSWLKLDFSDAMERLINIIDSSKKYLNESINAIVRE